MTERGGDHLRDMGHWRAGIKDHSAIGIAHADHVVDGLKGCAHIRTPVPGTPAKLPV